MLTPKEGGLDKKSFKEVKKIMLTTGTFDPNLWHLLNERQKFFINELKKSLRDLESR